MDKRIYLLTIVAFVVGMAELIIGGILDLIAMDLGSSLGKTGLLITVFSLVFAIAAPTLLSVTAKIERKRLMLFTLFLFFAGNVLAAISFSYSTLLMARVLSAASGSLLVVLCVTMASGLVDQTYRARAIGVVFMGISASLVLGVPIGLMLGNAFGWRAPFIMISVLSVLIMAGISTWMENMEPKPATPIRRQLRALKNRKILFAQFTSFFYLAGHLTLYGYLTPFLKTVLGLDGTWVSIVYSIFGLAAVAGGGLGGLLADRFGTKPAILFIMIVFGASLFAIPYTTFSFPLFIVVMMVWSMLSWAISPAMQSYLIELSPDTSDIQLSLNNSALHFGIAFGSFTGGIVIEQASVELNAAAGGLFIIVAFGTAVFSMAKKRSVSPRFFKNRKLNEKTWS